MVEKDTDMEGFTVPIIKGYIKRIVNTMERKNKAESNKYVYLRFIRYLKQSIRNLKKDDNPKKPYAKVNSYEITNHLENMKQCEMGSEKLYEIRLFL